jgi:hypothetical protein
MGLLNNIFSRNATPPLGVLPSGSFTIDREGRILTSTLGRTFPAATIQEIGEQVIEAFRASHQAQLPLGEITVHFAALKLHARELRGGAIIFMMPQNLNLIPRKP